MKNEAHDVIHSLERAMGRLERSVLTAILFKERTELDTALLRLAEAGAEAVICDDRAPVEVAIKRVHAILARHRAMANPQSRAKQIDDFPIG